MPARAGESLKSNSKHVRSQRRDRRCRHSVKPCRLLHSDGTRVSSDSDGDFREIVKRVGVTVANRSRPYEGLFVCRAG